MAWGDGIPARPHKALLSRSQRAAAAVGKPVPIALDSTQTALLWMGSHLIGGAQCHRASRSCTLTRSPWCSIGSLTGVPTGMTELFTHTGALPTALANAVAPLAVTTGR